MEWINLFFLLLIYCVYFLYDESWGDNLWSPNHHDYMQYSAFNHRSQLKNIISIWTWKRGRRIVSTKVCYMLHAHMRSPLHTRWRYRPTEMRHTHYGPTLHKIYFKNSCLYMHTAVHSPINSYSTNASMYNHVQSCSNLHELVCERSKLTARDLHYLC